MKNKKIRGEQPFVLQKAVPILDSNLILTTKKRLYDIKIVECGDYLQLYKYKNKKMKTNRKDIKDLELIKENKSIKIDINNKNNSNSLKEIELKNIIRSKLQCQRLAKSNLNDWELFITLTFSENIKDIEFANKKFRYFIDKIQRIKKDFKYICVPEFQKRGAIHYHILCNISINDKRFIYSQEDNPKFKHIKYWLDGFTSVEIIKHDSKKIIGYISKYMTKDIDNRLFSRHRYFYSRNLNKPKESFIDLSNIKELELFKKKIKEKHLDYQTEYINPLDNTKVVFQEYT